jgi:uncharacterized membrane protein YraQ (UPF0718 family)
MDEENKERRFRTLEELQQEYNASSHSFKGELKDILKNLKNELFSMWGMLIISALVLALLGAIVR